MISLLQHLSHFLRPTSIAFRFRASVAILLVLTSAAWVQAQTLKVTYGSKGVQTLSYGAVTLEDIGINSGDAFHIWHMKSTDLQGNVIPGWGENNNGEVWNPVSSTETYNFAWGTISTQFVQHGSNLDMLVTETNAAGSNIILDGAEIYPFALHFPQDPSGFSGYSQFLITSTGPGVSAADFGSGVVTAVLPDESVPMYVGWKNLAVNTYSPIMTTTAPDGLPSFLPGKDRPVPPGSSFTYTVSLRFTPEGTAAAVADADTSFANTYPSQMTWSDKRILGTAYLASSPASSGNSSLPGGFPTNPRRYFNDPSVDVTTPAGLAAFQKRMLSQAQQNVTSAQALNGQGVITWDIEGEQYPQATSYVCSPDQIATVSPEMESVITDPTSAFYGRKLDDAYFQTMTSAGLKVGVCLRPQVFAIAANGSATQSFLTSNAAIVANLENKARFANGRWGATIFYVDSTVDVNGGALDPAIFQQLITDLPSFLFIPEESTPRYYAYSAPFYSFIFHTTLGTAASIYSVYPHAFGANLVNDVAAATLSQYLPQLTQSVRNGDILMGHADYWQANDPTLVSVYQAAGISSPAPIQATPSITWSTPASIVYGAPLTATQLDASANTPGTFVYAPAAGTVLPAGNSALLATFTPADGKDYRSATASTTIHINQAVPTILWPKPSAISAGAPLSALQLNATANVPGTFSYNPPPGTVLAAGSQTLNVTFSPSDVSDYSVASSSVPLTVTAAAAQKPALSWPAPLAITYGTQLGSAQLNASASVGGVFTYSPSPGTILHAGVQTLTATFIPYDTTDYTTASTTTSLVISPATSILTWQSPAAISFGTPLSGSQLNAAASVPGTFSYSPVSGSLLPVGGQQLSVAFVPADSTDYTSATASVALTVTPAAAPNSKLAIAAPAGGAVVSGLIVVVGQCSLTLDSAGTYLMVDGIQVGGRIDGGPFLYPVDTTRLANGSHSLQLWGHDIGNNTTLSAPISITVQN